MGDLADLDPKQIEKYSRYLSKAEQKAGSGNLEASLQLFQKALEIHFSENLTAKIKKVEDALAVEEEDEGFVDVCQSGLMLYGEILDKLFDYQREGVAFLYKLYRDKKKGGILADDMGLGKTIQVITFLSGMFDADHIRSVLLILPPTLINNWEKEFAEWTPGLRVKVFHGPNKAERESSLKQIQSRKGVLITTYKMPLQSGPQLSSFGGKEFVWDYIIVDEAHNIKRPSAKTTKSLHVIPSKNRILLTGTPVQNNLNDLWGLFHFAYQDSLLGTMKTFQMEYEDPITRARAKDATPEEKALGRKTSENLMSIIEPYFLRRTKDELQKKKKAELPNHLPENQNKDVAPAILSLPRKNEFILWLFLAPIQEKIYRKFIASDHIKKLLRTPKFRVGELCILKKLCDHPRLLSKRRRLELEASHYSEQEVGENQLDERIEPVSDEMLIQESGKLSFLVVLLERLQAEGHKTLVFSLSHIMLDFIERVLTHKGFKFIRIDGTVTQLAEREKRIGKFQKDGDYSVLLLSTKVGGVGLTLTAASRVVIFDPSYSPARDAEAVDRVYRIGQKKNVVIYRLITCGTVEEKIYRRQVFKDSLMPQIMGDKKSPFCYFTNQEIQSSNMFTLEDTRSSATQLLLQSLHATQRKTDTELDEHIAYLKTLEIFGISDHDLMYTQETAHDDESKNEEAHRYIEHSVEKTQEPSTEPKMTPSKSSPGDTLGPSTSKSTSPTVVESPTPSAKKPPTPPPSPVVAPSVFDEVMDLVSDDDNDLVSDMVNLSSKMTNLVVEDMDDEQMLQIISNMEDGFPSEEKEHQFPSFRSCDLNPGTGLVSPFETHSVSIKEDYSPGSRAISELAAEDTDDEQMVFHATKTDVLHSKNKECQLTRLQAGDQNKSYPSDDGINQTETDMSLDLLPISQRDSCEIKVLDTVAPLENMVSKMAISTFENSGMRESAQSKYRDISCPYQVNFNLALEDSEDGPQTFTEKSMSVEETANEGFQLRLDSYCSSGTESLGRERGSHRGFQTSNGAESSVVMDDSNGPYNNRDSFGLGKKKRPAIILSDEEDGELIDELDEDKPDGICMSPPRTKEPMAAIGFSSHRSFVPLEETEDAASEAGTASNVSNDNSLDVNCNVM